VTPGIWLNCCSSGVATEDATRSISEFGIVPDQRRTTLCWRKVAVETEASTAYSSQRAAPQGGGAKWWERQLHRQDRVSIDVRLGHGSSAV